MLSVAQKQDPAHDKRGGADKPPESSRQQQREEYEKAQDDGDPSDKAARESFPVHNNRPLLSAYAGGGAVVIPAPSP